MASSDSKIAALTEYQSSLNDLDFNSKPMINVLTMLAEENESFAEGIVKIIRDRILQSNIKIKLPSLYLLDSILKNVGGDFVAIISMHMIEIFTNVFEKGDEKIRMSLFKLRNTWPHYFPAVFLRKLDLAVMDLDPNWPVLEIPSSEGTIHLNPRFILKEEQGSSVKESSVLAGVKHQQENLLAEEQRIQEQLRKLQEEQERIIESRMEKEKVDPEKFAKQKQKERELMIEEQQKQIFTLRKQQTDQEASFPPSIAETEEIKTDLSLKPKQWTGQILPEKEPNQMTLETEVRPKVAQKGGIENSERCRPPNTSQLKNLSKQNDKKGPNEKNSKSNANLNEKISKKENSTISEDYEALKNSRIDGRQSILSELDLECHHVRGDEEVTAENEIIDPPRKTTDNGRPLEMGVNNSQITAERRLNSGDEDVDVIKFAEYSGKVVCEKASKLNEKQKIIGFTGFEESSASESIKVSYTEAVDSAVEGNTLVLGSCKTKSSAPLLCTDSEKNEEGKDAMIIRAETHTKTRYIEEPNREDDSRLVNDIRLKKRHLYEGHDSTSIDQKLPRNIIGRKNAAGPLAPKPNRSGVQPSLTAKQIVDGRHQSDVDLHGKRHPIRQRPIISQTRFGDSFNKGHRNRRALPMDIPDKPLAEERFKNVRMRRVTGQNVSDKEGTKRNVVRTDDIEYKGIPRRRARGDFHHADRMRFMGPATRPQKRKLDDQRLLPPRQGARDALDGPKRLDSRMADSFGFRDQRFGRPRDAFDHKRYHYNPDYGNDQPTIRGQPPFNENVDASQYMPRTFNFDFHRNNYCNKGGEIRSQKGSLFDPGLRAQENQTFFRDSRDTHPGSEMITEQSVEQQDNGPSLTGNWPMRHHELSYASCSADNDGQFRTGNRELTDVRFREYVPSNINLETGLGQATQDKKFQESGRLSGKNGSSSHEQISGDVNDSFISRSSQNVTLSSSKDNFVDMIKDMSSKEKPLIDAGSSQPQTTSNTSSTALKKLFEGLVTAGILPTSMLSSDPAASPPPNIATVEANVPDIGFNIEQLKIRHDSVINNLYSGTQCGTCGLRFTQNDKKFYRDHLDWHFRNNRISKDGKRSASRTWYHFKELWINMDDVTDFEEQAKSAVFESEKKVQDQTAPASIKSCSVLREDEVCNICFEPFEQFWDETLEEWRYNDAIRIDELAYHANCYDDLGSDVSSGQSTIIDNVDTVMASNSASEEHEDLPTMKKQSENMYSSHLPHEEGKERSKLLVIENFPVSKPDDATDCINNFEQFDVRSCGESALFSDNLKDRGDK